MERGYCLGALTDEEQREKGLYTVNRLSVFDDDPDAVEPKCPFKDVDLSAYAHDDAIASWENYPFAGQTPVFPFKLSPYEELRQFLTPTPKKDTIESTRFALAESRPPPPRKRPSTDPGTSKMKRAQRRELARTMKRELYAAQGKCLTGEPLSPFCYCSKPDAAASSYDMPLPDGALAEHRPNILLIWLSYLRQTRQSHSFDLDDHPGSCLGGASIAPLPPSTDFNNKAKLPMELAHRAIQEYNDKECNVFKYQVLKIEKVNFSLQGYSYQYWLTVKVLNLTLVTPIETFQVHAGVISMNDDERVIYCYRYKEEEIVGLPSCDVCFGKLRGEEEPLGLEGVVRKGELPEKFLVHLNRWNDDDFIPKATSKEHREVFRRIYGRYFRQIFQSDGFDLDIYPGDAKEAVYIPYLDFEKEADMLWELANHAIQDYNNRETSVYKYKVSYIEKVNFSVAECREFYMTVKVINLTLRTPLETFQVHAFKGPHEENVVRLCRKKMRI